MRQFIVKKS